MCRCAHKVVTKLKTYDSLDTNFVDHPLWKEARFSTYSTTSKKISGRSGQIFLDIVE